MGMHVSSIGNFTLKEDARAGCLRQPAPARTCAGVSVLPGVARMCVDLLMVLAGACLALAELWLVRGYRVGNIDARYLLFWFVYLAVVLLSCHAHELYRTRVHASSSDDFFLIIRSQFVGAVLLLGIAHISGASIMSRWLIVAAGMNNAALLLGWRVVSESLASKWDREGCGARNVLVAGAGEVGRRIADHFRSGVERGYRFVGYLDGLSKGPQVLGHPRQFSMLARSHFVDVLIVTFPLDRELVKSLIVEARQMNIEVRIVPDCFDGLAGDSPIEHLAGMPVQVVQRAPMSHSALQAKRIVDILVSGILLLILMPVFAIVAVIVRLDSEGPIIYRAERVGRKRRTFVCYKFRTMVSNADAVKERLLHLNERDGLLFKIREDPRITRAGRFLRKYSLDELPQLWNILKGDMSLVGPRPAVTSEVEMYSLEHLERLNITPGLTGLWQVTARQDPSFSTYFARDVEYISTWSPLLDAKLLLKTIPAVLRGSGQ